MNADLEATLKELGKEYRPVIDRLRAGREVEPGRKTSAPSPRLRPLRTGWRIARIAASLAVMAGAVCLIRMQGRAPQDVPPPYVVTPTSEPPEVKAPDGEAVPQPVRTPYELALVEDGSALQEILRTQSADGSWANDVLTRQNAAALREADATSVAYRKAVRYLRTKGLAPLSADELHRLQRNARRV